MTTSDRGNAEALEVLAACQPLPIAVAERVVGPTVLDALEGDGIICVVPRSNGLAGLVMPADGTPLPTIGAVRRRAIARTVADAIEPQDADDVTPDVAVVLGEALAEADRYVEHVVTLAVRAALVRADIDRAIELAGFGLRHDPVHTELRHLLAMAHEAVGRHGAAAILGGDDEHDAAWLGRWSSNRFLSTGSPPRCAEPVTSTTATTSCSPTRPGSTASTATSTRPPRRSARCSTTRARPRRPWCGCASPAPSRPRSTDGPRSPTG